ncbi:class IV adenylate cyclase [Haloechinothrix sp. YIM 98757]|uniref:Class IV adenylate cyclase n=1 Tax=Haloechinothrix aidingensis TaxID=2752311 RepID=A0A838A9U4_9PSEU|nr:class IV adenylate cyclase [Haloechinothrix aidingensis]
MPTHLNVEIKARCPDADATLRTARDLGARLQGRDHQVDTYFAVPHGRLKLRQGTIENALIHYLRPDQDGPKGSHVLLYEPTGDSETLREALTAALGRTVVVDKHRHILWADNVKIHIDDVAGLGSFVEIEAIDRDGNHGHDRLLDQCQEYLHALRIGQDQLEARSYSDMLLEARHGP